MLYNSFGSQRLQSMFQSRQGRSALGPSHQQTQLERLRSPGLSRLRNTVGPPQSSPSSNYNYRLHSGPQPFVTAGPGAVTYGRRPSSSRPTYPRF